jgi:hypothetical protein
LIYQNVTGKYNWFRVKHTPSGGSNTAQFTIAQTVLLSYQVSIYTAGSGYTVGDDIIILGNRLGGEEPTNNLTITITSVNQSGGITGISWTGVSYNGVRTFVLSGTSDALGTVDKVLYR